MWTKLKLPPRMSVIHNVFHVSQLKKCVRLPTEIIAELEVEIELDLSYQEYPSKVLDCKERSLGLSQSKYIRSNGAITQRKKLLGRLRNFYVRTSPIVYLRESVRNHAQPLPLPFESKCKKNELNIK
jgi:hypothetical protein